MQTSLVSKILDRTIPLQGTVDRDIDKYHIYLIRDDEVVFYVGQAKDIYSRLEEHIFGTNRADPSLLGNTIIKNLPVSMNWTVELYSLLDLNEIPSGDLENIRETTLKVHINRAEINLIKKHRPCLNGMANPDPTPLPTRYIDPSIPDHDSIAQAFAKINLRLPPK